MVSLVLKTLVEDEYFVADLIGLKVVTDEGEDFGELTDVLFLPNANDVYVVETKEGKEVLLPVTEECILDIDLDEEVLCGEEWFHLHLNLDVLGLRVLVKFL